MADGVKVTAKGKHKNKDKKEDKEPYLVVGFEVNDQDAFTEDDVFFSKRWVHHLNVDYGHGFFYIVDDKGKVAKFFSFGPNGLGKRGWLNQGNVEHPNRWDTATPIKNGMADSRRGTPDYAIKEATKLFRVKLTKDQYSKLIQETDKERENITSGRQKYTAWVNDTCAEAARDVLKAAGVVTPSGTGLINMPPAWVYAVTPYMWHHNFKKAGYKEAEIGSREKLWETIMKNARENKIVDSDPATSQW